MGAAALPMALGALQAGLSTAGENAQSEQEAKIQDEKYFENRTAAVKGRDANQAQDNLEAHRKLEEVAGNRMDTAIAAMKSMEATRTAAGEAGVGGQSTALQIQDEGTAGLRQNTKFDGMVKDAQINNRLTAEGNDATMTNRINSVARGVAVKKSVFGSMLLSGLGTASSMAISKIGTTGTK